VSRQYALLPVDGNDERTSTSNQGLLGERCVHQGSFRGTSSRVEFTRERNQSRRFRVKIQEAFADGEGARREYIERT
jgi:hypothetical protein